MAERRPGRPYICPARARASRSSPAACRASSSATSTRRPHACSPPTATTCTSRGRRAVAARCTPTPAGSTKGVARARELEDALHGLRRDRHERRRLRLAPEGPRHARASSTSRSCSPRRRTPAERPSAADQRRLPGLLPPEARAADRRRATGRAPRDPGPHDPRAGRAGSLLRQRRHLQPRAAARGSRARRAGRRVTCSRREPDAYASGNPGCLVQVTAALRRAGRPLPAFHPIELVDASIRGVDASELLAAARR